jgi:hypothetical protein
MLGGGDEAEAVQQFDGQDGLEGRHNDPEDGTNTILVKVAGRGRR